MHLKPHNLPALALTSLLKLASSLPSSAGESPYPYLVMKVDKRTNLLLCFKCGMGFRWRQIMAVTCGLFSSAVLYLIFKLLMSVAEDFLGLIAVFLFYQVFVLIRYFLKIVVINGEFELIRIPYSEKE